MDSRSTDCPPTVRAGRLAKARQFEQAADTVLTLATEASDVADAYVTLCVHAGIAAADVICCARLGRYSRGESHHEATTLVASVDKVAARHLDTLLRLKTLAGYSHSAVGRERTLRAGRAMEALMATALAAG